VEFKNMSKTEEANCLSCRYVTGVSLLGISTYIWTQLKHQKTRASYTANGVLAVGVAVIGLARIFNTYPFKDNESNTA